MKIIVGLGNPGKKYTNTRHNVGFLGLEQIINKTKKQESKVSIIQEFKLEKKFDAEVAKLKLGKEDIILVKPQTFMNNSGIAVRKVVDFYKVNPEKDLIVIYDDIDIPLGKIKMRAEGSSAGHRGLQSIIDNLGTERFIRVRIGIGRPEDELTKIEDWVLQALKVSEKEIIENVIEDLLINGIQYLGM
ncbi:MAG TPA: aminoacyl-tRNA hydrolase [Patescibacteria group bacterium]|nr:aminoacyl-tRNA hydrolase [Patescibacteria group bacterium]